MFTYENPVIKKTLIFFVGALTFSFSLMVNSYENNKGDGHDVIN
jgi:hypothetical protein